MAIMYDLLELDGLPTAGDTIGSAGSGSDVSFLGNDLQADAPDGGGTLATVDQGPGFYDNGENTDIGGIQYDTPQLFEVTYDHDGVTRSGFVIEAVPDGGGASRFFFIPEDGVDPLEFGQITIQTANAVAFIDANDASQDQSVSFVCFAPGTLIRTPTGVAQVEELAPGDLVETLDHGPQPLVWCGARRLTFPRSPDSQKPIMFRRNCFGPDLPSHDLILSPQHRLLCETPENEHLIRAKSFEPIKGVRQMKGKRTVVYHALLFERHEVVFANGLAVESLYPGPNAMALLDACDRLAVIDRIPGVLEDIERNFGSPAREVLRHQKALSLARNRALRVRSHNPLKHLIPVPSRDGAPVLISKP